MAGSPLLFALLICALVADVCVSLSKIGNSSLNQAFYQHSLNTNEYDTQKENHGDAQEDGPGQKFKGALHTNQKYCYEDEKQGECASRIVQNGVASLTGWIVGATIAQAVVAGVVGVFTLYLVGGQLDAARQSADAAKAAADAAVSSAKAIDMQTSIQAEVLDVSQKQKEISRQVYIAVHRPRLTMRGFDGVVATEEGGASTFQWRITNAGDSRATAISTIVSFTIRHIENAAFRKEAEGELAKDSSLAPGEVRVVCYSFPQMGADIGFVFSPQGYDCRIRGYITYHSETGRPYQLGFSYWHDAQRKRFVRDDDPEHNYSD